MKQLSSLMILNVNGGDRVTFTYDDIDDETGEAISQNNKQSFYAVDPALKTSIEAVRTYIREHKLEE